MNDLPEGFTLDEGGDGSGLPAGYTLDGRPPSTGLPPGYTLDEPKAAAVGPSTYDSVVGGLESLRGALPLGPASVASAGADFMKGFGTEPLGLSQENIDRLGLSEMPRTTLGLNVVGAPIEAALRAGGGLATLASGTARRATEYLGATPTEAGQLERDINAGLMGGAGVTAPHVAPATRLPQTNAAAIEAFLGRARGMATRAEIDQALRDKAPLALPPPSTEPPTGAMPPPSSPTPVTPPEPPVTPPPSRIALVNMAQERNRLNLQLHNMGELDTPEKQAVGAQLETRLQQLEAQVGPRSAVISEPTGEMPPSPPSAAPVARPTNTMPANVVSFMQHAGELVAEGRPLTTPADILDNLPQSEEIAAKGGVNTGRLINLLGPQLYGGDPRSQTTTSVKELVQNSFDSVKGRMDAGGVQEGNIDIRMYDARRTISVRDDGEGMTPETLSGPFLEVAGTKKTSARSSGGLGIAKLQTLYGSNTIRVQTLRDGVLSTMETSGQALKDAAEGSGAPPRILIDRQAGKKAEVARLFPRGHGTLVEVSVPASYEDPATGEVKPIDFSTWEGSHPVLRHSPLFSNITVKLNGRPIEGMGSRFPSGDFLPLASVKFNWGTARVYVSRKPLDYTYNPNATALSNGLYQFNFAIKQDPAKGYGPNIKRQFYFDLSPAVKPEEAGYPFSLNRQEFTATAKKDFGELSNYLSLLYQEAAFEDAAKSFGSLEVMGPKGVVKRLDLVPNVPVNDSPLKALKPTDKVTVEEGRISVNGRQLPELTPDKLKSKQIDYESLKIPQDQFDPNDIVLHDNTNFHISPVEVKSAVQWARERYGKRFDEFIYNIGGLFQELRQVVANKLNYPDLRKEMIGISFDPQYRGVSIRIPVSGSFLNVAVPEYVTTPAMAALGFVGTMVHELAHHQVRSHNAEFPAEMQRIAIYLEAPDFGTSTMLGKLGSLGGWSIADYKQRVVNAVTNYFDIVQGLNGAYNALNPQPRGRRFEDASNQSTGDGGAARDLANDGTPGARGPSVPSGTVQRPPTASGVEGRPGFSLATSEAPVDSVPGVATNAAATWRAGASRDVPGVPFQPENEPLRQQLNQIFPPGSTTGGGSGTPPRGPATPTSLGGAGPQQGGSSGAISPGPLAQAAHADNLNRMYKYWAGLHQLADGNPHFRPLLEFEEFARMGHVENSKIWDAMLRVGKRWRQLGPVRGKQLQDVLHDLTQMTYRSPTEVKNDIFRQPTATELQTLLDNAGAGQDIAVRGVLADIKKMFDGFHTLVSDLAIQEAHRTIIDPVKRQARLQEIAAKVQMYNKQPFFPLMRFGKYFVIVHDAAGQVVQLETFERRGLMSAERLQQRRLAEIRGQLKPGEVATDGIYADEVGPLVGQPALLLQAVSGKMTLSPAMRNAARLLQTNSARNFQTRFQNKSTMPGYSMDFQRAFASYFFHGAHYYTRVKYAHEMEARVAMARAFPGNKAGGIANYMQEVLDNVILDARGDFGIFKGGIFLWAMGYVPSAAMINLSQTPMITLPFITAKFGPFKGPKALLKASVELQNYYKRGSYANKSDFYSRALDYGIKSGRITEAQASEIAGLSHGANMIEAVAGNRAQRGFNHFMQGSAWMFEMMEQYNRRLAYRAALQLALENPTNSYVQGAKKRYALEQQSLMQQGFSEAEATAIVTASKLTTETQFEYAKWGRPRGFRGLNVGNKSIGATVLTFKLYYQHILWMLAHNKRDVLPLYLITAALAYGLAGMPGYEDIKGLIKGLGASLFGKDWDADRAVREYVMQYTNGKIDPDLILHGLSRKGFGLPWLADLMGHNTGRPLQAGRLPTPYAGYNRAGDPNHSQNVPFPVFDRSKAGTPGSILPVDIGKMMEPDNPDKTIGEQAERASGAVFSVGFNMYKAIFDGHHDWTDWKRWEKAMPRFAGNISRTYRAYSEGRDRGPRGGPASAPSVVRYDWTDPEQMMELIGMSLGYNTFRESQKWDYIMAQTEVQKKFDMERTLLLEQYFEATMMKDTKTIGNVRDDIIKWNTGLPDWAKPLHINSETLTKSVRTRAQSLNAEESGVPRQVSKVPLARHIQDLFPGVQLDVRPVR